MFMVGVLLLGNDWIELADKKLLGVEKVFLKTSLKLIPLAETIPAIRRKLKVDKSIFFFLGSFLIFRPTRKEQEVLHSELESRPDFE